MKIAYQGIEGSYSYHVSQTLFPEDELIGHKSFYSAITSVKKGEADRAVLPVENNTAGRVMEVHNLLPDAGLSIVGEYLHPVHHHLMIPKGAIGSETPTEEEVKDALATIEEVKSHPQALTQCKKYIHDHLPKALPIPSFDTAGAARDICKNQDGKIAAIASKAAARIYDMVILREEIEDITTNTTRFLILSDAANAEGDVDEKAITTILFDTKHQPGSLIKALQIFQDHGINLTKLETYMSGPTKPNPSFYVDVGASIYNKNMQNALKAFENETEKYTIMGCYSADKKRMANNGFLAI